MFKLEQLCKIWKVIHNSSVKISPILNLMLEKEIIAMVACKKKVSIVLLLEYFHSFMEQEAAVLKQKSFLSINRCTDTVKDN